MASNPEKHFCLIVFSSVKKMKDWRFFHRQLIKKIRFPFFSFPGDDELLRRRQLLWMVEDGVQGREGMLRGGDGPSHARGP